MDGAFQWGPVMMGRSVEVRAEGATDRGDRAGPESSPESESRGSTALALSRRDDLMPEFSV